jgi:hypothetical protein
MGSNSKKKKTKQKHKSKNKKSTTKKNFKKTNRAQIPTKTVAYLVKISKRNQNTEKRNLLNISKENPI